MPTDPRPLKAGRYFFEGPVFLDNINCLGTEESLADCNGGSVYGNVDDCVDIAAVYCEGINGIVNDTQSNCTLAKCHIHLATYMSCP